MRLNTGAVAAIGISMLVAIAFAGCGGNGGANETATAGAQKTSVVTPGSGGGSQATQELCASIADLQSMLGVLVTSRTKDDLKSAAQSTKAAAERVKQAAQEAHVTGAANLQNALDEFTSSIDDAASSDRPLVQSLAVVASATADIQGRLQDVQASAGCDLQTPAPSATLSGG